MNFESDDILEEYEIEAFELDQSLVQLGINEAQQQKIYEAKKEAAEQFNFLTKRNKNRFIKIKEEIQQKIIGIENQNKSLKEENQELKKEIEKLVLKIQQKDEENIKNLEQRDAQNASRIQSLEKALASQAATKPDSSSNSNEKALEKKLRAKEKEAEKITDKYVFYKELSEQLAKVLYRNTKSFDYTATVDSLKKYIKSKTF